MQEQQDSISKEAIEQFLKDTLKAESVEIDHAQQIGDPFNEVSKAAPPDYAWYVQARVKMPDEDAEWNTFQVGEKDGKLAIYCTWDYALFG